MIQSFDLHKTEIGQSMFEFALNRCKELVVISNYLNIYQSDITNRQNVFVHAQNTQAQTQ